MCRLIQSQLPRNSGRVWPSLLVVILILLLGLGINAGATGIEQLSAFISNTPSALVLRFSQVEIDRNGNVLRPKSPTSIELPYRELIMDGTNYAVIKSTYPLETGVHPNQVAGRGRSTNGDWLLFLNGQIQYYTGKENLPQTLGYEAGESRDLLGYHTVQTVLNLGIDAKLQSISWVGSDFRALESPEWPKEIDPKTGHVEKLGVVLGQFVMSNALPAMAVYQDGIRSGRVHYSYDTNFAIPFPSQIKVDRSAKLGPASTNTFLGSTIFIITDLRETLSPEERAMCDPRYFGIENSPAEKLGSVVVNNRTNYDPSIFIFSNGTPVAVVQDSKLSRITSDMLGNGKSPLVLRGCLIVVFALGPIVMYCVIQRRRRRSSGR